MSVFKQTGHQNNFKWPCSCPYHARHVYKLNGDAGPWLIQPSLACRCAPRPQHEVRLAAVQPQGVLPRGAPALSLPQLRLAAGGRDLQRGPRRRVRLSEAAAYQPVLRALCRYFCGWRLVPVPVAGGVVFLLAVKWPTLDIERILYTIFDVFYSYCKSHQSPSFSSNWFSERCFELSVICHLCICAFICSIIV